MLNISLASAVAFLCLIISCVHAADLRPDQQAAIAKILASMDPGMRDIVRPQLEMSIQHLTPEQVALFVGSIASDVAADSQPASEPETPSLEASAEDLAFNRAQYEPILRQHWDAKKAFDNFVDAELKMHCPDTGKYAVYREAERYEIMGLNPQWQRAPDSKEAEASIIGSTYAPQDGRYQFDFSKVRMTFNKDVVSGAIVKACAEWTKEAAIFKDKAGKLMHSGESQAALDLQGSASSKVNAIQMTLQDVLNAEGPAGNYNSAMMEALQNPKRIGVNGG